MARLPIEGSDVGNWGELLNTFLRIEHAEDGTLKSSGSLSTKYTWPLGGIPKADLSAAVQASLQRADIALVSVPVISKQDVGLANVTDDAQLPLIGGVLSGALTLADTTALTSSTTLSTDLGAPTIYFRDSYSRRHFFNATANFDGTATGVVSANCRVFFNSAVDQSNSVEVANSVGVTRALADTNGPVISMYKRGTTGDASAAVKSGNTIFALQGFGYYGSGYSQQATLAFNATQDWSAAARGTSLSFLVTANGSTARTVALSIGQNSQLTVNGDLSLANTRNIITSVTTGTKIAITASQKLGFYGAAPVARPTGVQATAAGLYAALVSLGLIS